MKKKVASQATQAHLDKDLRLHDGTKIQLVKQVHYTRRPGWEARVFEAIEPRNPARRYAVKLYGDVESAQGANDHARRRARRALQIGRLFDHPGIIRTIGLADEVFLVTEWIEGPRLSQIMTKGKYTVEMAWTWIIALGEALAALTYTLADKIPACGHGDVQPTNVILSPDSHRSYLKLIDLDYVGRHIHRPTPISATDLAWTQQVGRRVLKPPEYALGTEPFLDTCSDVFSFGLIVFWLHHRTPAFSEDNEYQHKVLALAKGDTGNEADRFPSRVWGLRTDPLGQVLMQMTAFNRAERLASVADALAALKTVVPVRLF